VVHQQIVQILICRGISVRNYHTIPSSSFCTLILAYGAQLIFNGNFFIYRPICVKLSGIFAPPLWGLKVKKIGGGGPLLGEFNGEVETLAPNFSPPNYWRAAVRGGLDAEARALPNFIRHATWAFKFWRKKLFYKNFFFGQELQGKNGGKFSGITGGLSYTVPIDFSRGGIAILWLRFASGSLVPGPPNLGGKNYFPKKFFSAENCRAKTGGNFQG